MGYPGVPALYILANVLIAGGLLVGSTRESLVSLLVLAAGWPVYAWLRGRAAGREG